MRRWCTILLLLFCLSAATASEEQVIIALPEEAELAPGEELPVAELVLMLREARILQIAGMPDEALSKLREAEETFPQSVLPVTALWDHHRQHRLPAEEQQRLRELLTRRLADPESPLPQGTLAYLVELADPTDEYLELLLQSLKSRTAHGEAEPRYLEAMVVLNERLGRLPEAREQLGKLLEVQPTEGLYMHCLGLDERLERWPDVAKGLERLLERDPFYVFRIRYIEVLAKLGRFEEVVQQLDLLSRTEDVNSAQLRQGLVQLLLQVAWDLRDAGRHEGAESIFRRLLDLDPSNAEARNAILHLYGADEERAAHERALEERWRAEEDPDALARQGSNILAGGDAAGAFEMLSRAVEGAPDSEVAWFNLGLAAIRLERWSDAERAFEVAVTLNPGRADGYLHRGAALQRLGRCREAIPLLKKALALDAGQGQAHYYLYFCYHEVGDYDASMEHRWLYERSIGGAGR